MDKEFCFIDLKQWHSFKVGLDIEYEAAVNPQ